MEFGSPLDTWQWVVLGAIPPAVVALYFLKLRRQPLEVPSTYLWRKSIEDLHVNSFWQRMRRSLLLLLQLLFVALVAFALARPYWQGSRTLGQRSIFLIDNSASMGATDLGGGQTRLAAAKRRAAELIDAMQAGDAAMIVSFSDTARVEHAYTESQADLRRALDRIVRTQRTTRLDEALRVASGLANPSRSGDKGGVGATPIADALPADLYILSDGKFPDVANFSLGNLHPIFEPIGSADASNIAIRAFSAQRNEERPDRVQAFFEVENFGREKATFDVEWYLDDGQVARDVKRITLEGGATSKDVFDLGEVESGVLRLKIGVTDALAVDNEAFAAFGIARKAKVLLVTAGNDALSFALGTSNMAHAAAVSVVAPDTLAKPEVQKTLAGGEYDLVIFDGCVPKAMPQTSTLFIGQSPPTWERAPKSDKDKVPIIIDVDHAHPLMQSVELSDVIVAESLLLKPPAGHARLIETQLGVIAAIAPRDAFQDAVLGFVFVGVDESGERYSNTNWTRKLSFPVFMQNVVNNLGGRREAESAGTATTGKEFVLRSEGATDQLTVRTPHGKSIEVQRGQLGKFHFLATNEVGVYEVREKDRVIERFTVNLFDRNESDIRPRQDAKIKIGYVPVEAQTRVEIVRREGWKWLAAVALAVLLFEWYIYNRRVYL